ncbi:MAG: DUF2236 domain-containing protein [Deltaproteobacteria bacterium]|nr:DUF2236 domain-containing protein [Deltaproteobacteria bacterium]
MTAHGFPSRFIKLPQARARFGDRVDRLGAFLHEGDPLADAVVDALAPLDRPARESLVALGLARGPGAVEAQGPAGERLAVLLAHLERTPFWVDHARADRGGAAFLRAGALGGMVLGTYSLVAGYCSPAGNKPLAFSGRLTEEAPRRLGETGRYVQAVCTPGGLRRHGEGWRASVRVRLLHASVRRLLGRHPRWDAGCWGEPINQYDMSGTNLLFSWVVTDGLERLDAPFTAAEREDYLHLWRYAGWLMGVREELLAATAEEARTLWELVKSTQGPPDEDSRGLARALLESPLAMARSAEERRRVAWRVPFGYALSRHFIGDEYALALGYPPTGRRWRAALWALRRAARSGTALVRALPDADRRGVSLGLRYWDRAIQRTVPRADEAFPLAEALRRR